MTDVPTVDEKRQQLETLSGDAKRLLDECGDKLRASETLGATVHIRTGTTTPTLNRVIAELRKQNWDAKEDHGHQRDPYHVLVIKPLGRSHAQR